jgi:hypothetical protein
VELCRPFRTIVFHICQNRHLSKWELDTDVENEETQRLKSLVADLSMSNELLREKIHRMVSSLLKALNRFSDDASRPCGTCYFDFTARSDANYLTQLAKQNITLNSSCASKASSAGFRTPEV